jgi:ABC-type glycerol-3-phosphate transport system substrate-binding protein
MKTEKKSLSRREFLRLSALGTTGLILASCGGQAAPAPAEKPDEAPAAASEGEEAPGEAPAAATVLIRYQSREPEMAGGILQLWETFYPKFQEENPGIEVEFLPDPGGGGQDRTEKALAQMVAGDAPDLTEWCCAESTLFMQKGETLDLQPLIDRDAEEVNLDDYYPGQFNPWKDENGNIHLMPRFTGTQVIYYNKDMFDKAGVEYPSAEWGAWNFDDYVEIGKKFVKTEQPQIWATSNYGYGANWLSQYLIRGFGGNMVDPEDNDRCGLCDEPAIEALNWIHKGIWEDQTFAYGSSLGGLGVLQLFLGERIPMMEMGPWNLGPVVEGARFKWDVAPMPDGPAGPTTHQSVDGTMIWRGTKNPEESWLLMKGLTSPWYGELYARYATKQPSRKSVLPLFSKILREQNPIYQDIKLEVFTDSIAKGLGGPEEMFSNDQVCKQQILQPAFDQVLLENKAPVDLICKHAEVATKFNRGEIKIEELGAALDAL